MRQKWKLPSKSCGEAVRARKPKPPRPRNWAWAVTATQSSAPRMSIPRHVCLRRFIQRSVCALAEVEKRKVESGKVRSALSYDLRVNRQIIIAVVVVAAVITGIGLYVI